MPKYRYVAVDDWGNKSRGALEAASIESAAEELKRKGLWILDLFDQSKSILYREIRLGEPRVKSDSFTAFCRQLATMYKAGVNLVEAVRTLAEQTESKPFRAVLSDIADEMHRGAQFSAAAAKYPHLFSVVFVSMIRAGEASGKLDEMLNRLAVFYEKEYYTREKVKSAMVYPAVMAIVAAIVVTLMMTFIVPKYIDNFQAMGIELPFLTRVVIAASRFVQSYWYIVGLCLFLPGAIRFLIRRSRTGLYYWDFYKLKLPVFGPLYQKQAVARFSRTFGSLYAAAIPMLKSLAIVSTVTGNEAIRRVILEAREAVGSGQSIADPFRASPLFPPMVVQMLAVGEKTGDLDGMLDKVADFYEADVDAMADRMKSLLEPLMIVALSAIVGGIITAIMLPVFHMMGNMQDLP